MKATAVNVRVAHLKSGEAGDGKVYDNLREWMGDPCNVYVGRRGVVFIDGKRFPEQDSPFCNPYKVKPDRPAEDAVLDYKIFVLPTYTPEQLASLKGKRLGCWCHPNTCHAQALADLVNRVFF